MARLSYCLMLIFSISSASVNAERLFLATTHWCPYVCESEQQPGFITEYLRALLKKQGIELEVAVLPWARAVSEARDGRYQGLLTAVQAEAPDFPLTTQINGSYQLCFYRRSGSEFQYTNRESLQGITVGVIKGYGYDEPIASMLAAPLPEEELLEVSTDQPLISLLQMLKARRLDTLISDQAVMEFTLKSNNLKGIEQAGCLAEQSFYLALSPAYQEWPSMMQRLNSILAQPEATELRQYYRNRNRYR